VIGIILLFTFEAFFSGLTLWLSCLSSQNLLLFDYLPLFLLSFLLIVAIDASFIVLRLSIFATATANLIRFNWLFVYSQTKAAFISCKVILILTSLANFIIFLFCDTATWAFGIYKYRLTRLTFSAFPQQLNQWIGLRLFDLTTRMCWCFLLFICIRQ